MRCAPRCLFILIIALLAAHASLAQVTTGKPPFGSFGGGPVDTINLANLNAHLSIPVINKPGRGMPFTFNLAYDTSVWYPIGTGTTGDKTWQNLSGWGWTLYNGGEIGYLTADVTIIDSCSSGWVQQYANFIYHDANAVTHVIPGGAIDPIGTCPGNPTSPTMLSSATIDGSGYRVYFNAGNGSATLITPSDVTFQLPAVSSGSLTASNTDSNGNQITAVDNNGTYTYTDTLGTIALVIAGAPPNPMTFTYTAPSGGTAAYTMRYASYTVQTNFQCSGISEFSQTNVPLVSEIDLPDGTRYTFTYEPTPGYSGSVTGRLASITLPTGGTISYSYSGGNNGIVCTDGTAATLTRTTPDGVWTYAHSESNNAWATTTTDPAGNQTVQNFRKLYETERQIYQGSATSGNLLKTVATCYDGKTLTNGDMSSCNSYDVFLPMTRRLVFVELPGTNGLEMAQNNLYTWYGSQKSEKDECAYAAGAPGPVVRSTYTSYYQGNKPATVLIDSYQPNQLSSYTRYSYDESAPTSTSAPQHGQPTGAPGNLTSIYYYSSASTALTKTFTYFDTGNVQTATDVNGAKTTYEYNACGNAFPTFVIEPLGLLKAMSWNCAGGVEASATDENGQTVTTAYDDPYFWRPSSTTDQEGNVTNFTYDGQTSVESALNFGSSTVDVLKTADALGRNHLSQTREGPSSGTFDSVETDYDNLGRPYRTTLPYAGGAGQTNSSAPSTVTAYDALGRGTQVTNSAGQITTASYIQNDAYQTVGPAPSGENTKRKQSEYDALGRLTSVCEVTSLSGSGTCAQTSPASGYWTKYTYDALDDLIGVTQNAQSSSTQTRTYTYDDLKRMTSETNPETGTTAYVYDSDSTCGTSAGDLVKKIDAVGNTSCYTYDALHRNTSITYSGPYASSTPNKYFVYDSATVNGAVMTNAKSRMAEAYTATCSTCAKITDVVFGYTPRGEVSDVYESTPNSGGYYHVVASYWANGAVNQVGGLPGLPAIAYGVDGEGRAYSASDSNNRTLLTSTAYNVASLPTQVNLGSSDSDSFAYNPNTNSMTQYQFKVNSQPVVGNLTWNANQSLAGLSITDPFDSANNQTCAYSYDDLSRLASDNCGSIWSQAFWYDPFGNIEKSGTMSFQAVYSPSTNRMTSIGSSYPSYDANGNVTNDFLHTYAWDAEGRPVTIDGVGVTYDALGRMAERNNGGTYSQIVYSPSGAKLAIMNGQTLQKGYAPLTAGSMAVYSSTGVAYFRHSDWLGSSRFASTANSVATAGSGSLSITGSEQSWGGSDASGGTESAGFAYTGPLNTARYFHTATLLSSGTVLIAGGVASSSVSSSAELYTPSTGKFTATGSMTTARYNHTATLLSNGMVLITGGTGSLGGSSALSSAELYNPSNGTFTATGSMTTARYDHTATLLSNGMVLIAGGYGSSGALLSSAELYNPSTGTFTATGSMTTSRQSHTATLLNDGTVLIAGGLNASGALSSAEIYSSSTGTFLAIGSMTTGRYWHTATLLSNGMVLIAGGGGSGSVGNVLSSAELYNPVDGTFTATGGMTSARSSHTATLLNNGMVLIAGGLSSSGGSFGGITGAEVYNPSDGTFIVTGSLNQGRSSHTATLLNDGTVLAAGGSTNPTPLSTAELFQLSTPTGGTPGSGTATVSGTEHSVVTGAPGKGTITIDGSEQNFQYCDSDGNCGGLTYDWGYVSLTVNGVTVYANYGSGGNYATDTTSSVAASLESAVNASSSIPVTATLSGSTVTLTAKTPGTSTNYSFSSSYYSYLVADYPCNSYDPCPSSSFWTSQSGSHLTGGTNTGNTTWYDIGTVWVTVNGLQASASYGQGSTSSTVASAIAGQFTGSASAVTASASGATITFTAKWPGAFTDYSITCGSSTSRPTLFSSPSFAFSCPATLTGGANGTPTNVTGYDAGTVWVTVNGTQVSANYGENSTASSLANTIASGLNSSSSPVTATVTGETLTLTAKATGSGTDYTVSCGSSSSQSSIFSQPSFGASCPGALTGGGSAGSGGTAMYSDGAYAPFGEPYAQAGAGDLSFTGKNQDTVPNLYDFPAREYGIQGRWPSPDPSGIFLADLTDPQQVNLYSYVRNNPLNAIDPFGLACVENSDGSDYDDSSGGETCADADADNAAGGYTVIVTTSGSCDDLCQINAQEQANYYSQFDNLLAAQAAPTSGQLVAAVAQGTQMAGSVIPTVCSAGVFAYRGGETNGVFLGTLQEYDFASGYSNNVLTEYETGNGNGAGVYYNINNPSQSGGIAFHQVQSWWGVVGFGSKSGLGGGVYAGGENGGAGAYATVTTVNNCNH
jgi:RHS repeat-associated protein